MALLTTEQIDRIPNLYAQEEVADPIVHAHISCMKSTWLITECCSETGALAFGYADLFGDGICGELGYISLEEIESLKSQYPVIVKELHKPLSQMKHELGI